MKLIEDSYTGIVLCGGAVRGFAHLGVIRALQESGISPDIVSAVSAGSLAGAFDADEPEDELEIFEASSFYKLVRFLFRGTVFSDPKGLKKLLKSNISTKEVLWTK